MGKKKKEQNVNKTKQNKNRKNNQLFSQFLKSCKKFQLKNEICEIK